MVPGDEVPHEAPRRRQVFRLELLGRGRAVGPQRGRHAQALGGRAPERRVLRRGCRGAIVAAYEHGLVFTKEDIARLIATNRDFMWNKQIKNAKFQRIDGGKPDPRWANSPGMLWDALAPYDPTLRKIFEANYNPGDWGGMSTTPEWVARFGPKSKAAQ